MQEMEIKVYISPKLAHWQKIAPASPSRFTVFALFLKRLDEQAFLKLVSSTSSKLTETIEKAMAGFNNMLNYAAVDQRVISSFTGGLSWLQSSNAAPHTAKTSAKARIAELRQENAIRAREGARQAIQAGQRGRSNKRGTPVYK